jgi:hypothetical protein
MSTVRMIFGGLASVIEQNRVRRRERFQCLPSCEQMEPRALLSSLNVGVATLIPPKVADGALVVNANQAPSFNDSLVDQGNVENTDPSGP